MTDYADTPEEGGPFQLLEVDTPAFTRIKSPHERKRAKQGKWVWTAVGNCDSFAFDPNDPSSIYQKGCDDPALLAMVVHRLWCSAPDIGFAVRKVEGVTRWGYLCSCDALAEFYEAIIGIWRMQSEDEA